jgi:hypothetical protein
MRKIGILAGAAILAAGFTFAADEKPAAPAMDQKAAMDMMMKLGTPSEGHRVLDAMIGKFDAKVTEWEAPGASPMVSDAVSEMSWVLGGRFVEQKNTGTFMGMPYTGVGYTGYDNYKKQYIGNWMDSMGTAMMVFAGTADASGKVITEKTSIDDFTTGKKVDIDAITRIVDHDHFTYEMWMPGPDGKNFKMMQIDYTRKK